MISISAVKVSTMAALTIGFVAIASPSPAAPTAVDLEATARPGPAAPTAVELPVSYAIEVLNEGFCSGCKVCPNPNEAASTVGGEGYWWLTDFYCGQLDAPCDTFEDPEKCPGGNTEEEVEALLAAIAAGDAAAIAHQTGARSFRMVPSRQAVQVLDCSGDHVINHFELPLALAEQVMNELAQ